MLVDRLGGIAANRPLGQDQDDLSSRRMCTASHACSSISDLLHQDQALDPNAPRQTRCDRRIPPLCVT